MDLDSLENQPVGLSLQLAVLDQSVVLRQEQFIFEKDFFLRNRGPGESRGRLARTHDYAFEFGGDRFEQLRLGPLGNVVLVSDVQQKLREIAFSGRNLEANGRVEVAVGDHQVPDDFVEQLRENEPVVQPVVEVDVCG